MITENDESQSMNVDEVNTKRKCSFGWCDKSEKDPNCPLGDLIFNIKQTVKRLCQGCPEEKINALTAAANAACNAIEQSKGSKSGEETTSEVVAQNSACSALPFDDITTEKCNRSKGITSNNCIPKVETTPAQVVSSDQILTPQNAAAELTENLSKEFTCPICKEIFMKANTLRCNHTFCQVCIDSWLHRSHTCPLCRHAVELPPNQTHALDNAISELCQMKGSEYCNQRVMSFQEHQREEFQKCEVLQAKLDVAKSKGAKFVDIARAWSPREQHRFFGGLRMYKQGEVRRVYCSTVRLTDAFIQRASQLELAVAASNLNIKDHDELSILQLRNRLLMFVKYS